MRTRRKILAVMGLSGALAGLGGASQMGDFRVPDRPDRPAVVGYGYTGIVVAALARYNPFAVVLVAVLLGGLQNAGFTLQGADFPSGLVGVMQGMILFSDARRRAARPLPASGSGARRRCRARAWRPPRSRLRRAG